jgi:flagellum-specific ATP synthase
VLVEGDDMNEPVADHARSILDGHCVLTRSLAHRGHYPAIDVLESVSRLATEITSDDVRAAATALRETIAVHRAKDDLISIGAYAAGSDPMIDYAIAKLPQIDAYLRQGVHDRSDTTSADADLLALMADRPGGPV